MRCYTKFMEIEKMNIEELKQEWVYTINDFDSYKDKKEWSVKLKDLEKRIGAKSQP